MRCVLLCTVEAVEGGLCFLELSEAIYTLCAALYFSLSSFRSSRLFGQTACGDWRHL